MTDFLVELSDTLVADLDVDALLHWVTERCVRVLDVQAAGIMLADDRGVLQLLAAVPEYTPGCGCSKPRPRRAPGVS
ncbi:hypothetical protein [Actinoplanes sp. CA-252034]|uniref:hypothetical protein n=1 Tax=Actinoplanes sp. CA-252034 TaxID=3239906 RepID=UPI003D99BD64